MFDMETLPVFQIKYFIFRFGIWVLAFNIFNITEVQAVVIRWKYLKFVLSGAHQYVIWLAQLPWKGRP